MNKKTDIIIPVLAAVIFNENGEVLLAQRRSGLSQALKWEFPGGKLRVNEEPEECLKREIQEELGMEIQIKDIFHVVNHSYPDKNILLIAYRATLVKEGHLRTDHQKICWCNIRDLLKYDLSEADIPIAEKLKKELANKKV